MVHYPVPTKDLRVAALNRQLLRDQKSSTMGKRKRVRRRRKHVVRSICSFNEQLLLFTFYHITFISPYSMLWKRQQGEPETKENEKRDEDGEKNDKKQLTKLH